MDFLENVKSIMADTAKVVVKKSGELVEASKTQYFVIELKNDIRKLYSEIGKLTYSAIEEGEDHTEDIRTKCAIISAKLAKIDALKSKEVESGVVCPSCGRTSDFDEDYCPSCGEDMTVDAEAEVIE